MPRGVKGSGPNGNGKQSHKNGTLAAQAAVINGVGVGKLSESELGVLAIYFVQEAGERTVAEVHEKVLATGVVASENDCKRVLEGARRRGILSISSVSDDFATVSKSYVMRRVIWSHPLEVANLHSLISALFETPEARALKAELDNTIAEGGEEKPANRQQYKDYLDITVEAETTDYWLGATPYSPAMKAMLESSPYKVEQQAKVKLPGNGAKGGKAGKEDDEKEKEKENKIPPVALFFLRADDGALVVGADCVSGSLSRVLRFYDVPESLVDHAEVSEIRFHPDKPLLQCVLPVIDSRGMGAGLNAYEALQPGEHFTLRFTLPTKVFRRQCSAEFWKRLIARWLERPDRGLSPARGKRFGHARMIKFTAEPLNGE